MREPWWQAFFDLEYLTYWGALFSAEQCEADAQGLIELLELKRGARILDAPCGYGRIAEPLARRGMVVTGIDQSKALLRHAESKRGSLGENVLSYVQADLRSPLPGAGEFDCALSLFSSVGYGSEEDDLKIFQNIAEALKPGGTFFVETMHRDALVSRMVKGEFAGKTLPDGTAVREDPRFDPIAGVIETTWSWKGPSGSGSKSAVIRIYSATELAALLGRAGFVVERAVHGISNETFGREPENLGKRLGLIARKPTN